MKNLIKSKPLITAGIIAVFCVSILLICIIFGKREKAAFVPDDPINLADPIESWTENETSSIIQPEIIGFNSVVDEETTISSEEFQLEEFKEEVSTKIEEPEEELIINLTESVPDKTPPPESPGTNDEMPAQTPEHIGKPQSSPNAVIPESGSFNEEGAVYLPGFGWIPYSGPNKGKQSGSDGDWNKMIGSFN